MDTPDLVAELQAEGLTPKEAAVAATVLAGAMPPTDMFDGIWIHELTKLRNRIDAGEATNDDARRLLEEVARLNQIIGWAVHDPAVRDALRAAREKHGTRPRL